MKVLYEVRNIMKKAICLGIVLSFLIVFFSFSVSAQGITFAESKYNSQVVSGVTANITVTRYYPNNEGTSAVPGSTYLPYMVYIQLYNNNEQAALVNSLRANLVFVNNNWIPQIFNIDNFSDDLTLSFDGDTVGCRVSPSGSFSYGNGIVVPPHQSLYLIAEIQIRCDWQQTNTSDPYTYPNLDSVSCGNFTVGTGDYPYGSNPIDLSPVINAIDSLAQTVSTSTELTQLISIMTYSGSDPSVSYSSGDTSYHNFTATNNMAGFLFMRHSKSVYEVYDYEYDTTNDTALAVGTKRVYFDYLLNIKTYNPINARYYATLNILPSNINNVSVVITDFSSDVFSYYDTFNGVLDLYNQHTITTQASFIPYGNNYTHISGYYECEINTSISLRNANNIELTNIFGSSWSDYSGYAPRDEYSILKDLYIAYTQVNGVGDVSSDSGSLENQSNSNHTIEESYYSANSDAILATGLSNYRFSNDQSNGIGAVSNDFTAVWNALGSFNSVYIFSLTLSIALMIFRHVPGVIRGRFKTRNDGDG